MKYQSLYIWAILKPLKLCTVGIDAFLVASGRLFLSSLWLVLWALRAASLSWLSRSCSRSSRRSNRPGRCSGRCSSCHSDCRSSRRSSCRSKFNHRSSPLRSNSSSSISSISTKPSPPSSRSLPLSCICKITGSGETSVVTFVAAFAEVEEAAVS